MAFLGETIRFPHTHVTRVASRSFTHRYADIYDPPEPLPRHRRPREWMLETSQS